MRVALFTDTLGDINGVSRFIRNVAEQSLVQGMDLHVVTSTRFECPRRPNIHLVEPVVATRMPKYENLEVVLPPGRRMLGLTKRLTPDVVHVSTPGPVGAVGRRIARRLGLPLVGTYHTDFPAYIDHLFDDAACTWICTQTMRRFYRPFARIFTRSADYAGALVKLGVAGGSIVRLLPGIDTEVFHTRFRDQAIWRRFAEVRPGSVKVLYVGRVSVEKNLPFLTRVWKRVAGRAGSTAVALIVVGDGPYRAQMERELAGTGAHFLGFRHGAELSALYASSDLFVFPSTTDTLGQVVMEAQSAGLPVVVTDKGGPSEVVDRGRTGYVLPSEDGEAWGRTILELAGDPARRGAMGAAGHAKIQPMSIGHSFRHFWSVHEEAAAEAARLNHRR